MNQHRNLLHKVVIYVQLIPFYYTNFLIMLEYKCMITNTCMNFEHFYNIWTLLKKHFAKPTSIYQSFRQFILSFISLHIGRLLLNVTKQYIKPLNKEKGCKNNLWDHVMFLHKLDMNFKHIHIYYTRLQNKIHWYPNQRSLKISTTTKNVGGL
jgi:hypothetical protein